MKSSLIPFSTSLPSRRFLAIGAQALSSKMLMPNAAVSALFKAPQKETGAERMEISSEVQPEPANALNYADFEEMP